MNNKRNVGNIALNSVVKFPRNPAKYKVLEHKDGFTHLLELEEEPFIFGLSKLVVVDWFTVQLVEGF